MVNEKQCYKQFCKITDGKENEGYIEWKEWVLEQVKGYDKKQLTNLVKRTEINVKKMEASCQIKDQGIMPYGISLMSLLLTLVVTVYLSSMGNIINIYSQTVPDEIIEKYGKIVTEFSTSETNSMLIFCGVIIILLIILLASEAWARKKILRYKYNSKIYYEELLKILEEKIL